jgi:hypothetical protein
MGLAIYLGLRNNSAGTATPDGSEKKLRTAPDTSEPLEYGAIAAIGICTQMTRMS